MAKTKTFSGINNLDAAERLADEELRAAVNVDVDRTGRVTRRDGYEKIYSGTNIHSIWSDTKTTLFVENGALKRIDDNNNVSTLRSGAAIFGRMSFAESFGNIGYADGRITGVIGPDGVSRPLGLQTPHTRPALTPTEGVLPAGQYGVAFTVADSTGAESGATLATYIELPEDNSGIAVSGLSLTSGAVSGKIYMTRTNGDVFYEATLSSGTAILTGQPQGEQLRTEFLEPMPNGNVIAFHKGITLIADGNYLYYSEPFSYLTRRGYNFIPFAKPINMIAPVEDGFFISTEGGATYHVFGNDPDKWSFTEKAPYSVITGTAVPVEAGLLPTEGGGNADGWIWATARGICMGTAGGGFQNLTAKKYAPVSSSVGAALLRQIDGRNQYISSLHPQNGEANNIYFSDVAVAEIRRNGVVVT